ncbi:hypothetical protein CONPUDRAFT_148121 [Coniophora puteana RWD-64-598 SS2]|uniref:F-box domain-containing protein n=1 Tax=Coniophora puteana (strain RWD-64-598) TaxID=741705 RepID=A0A5M3N3Q2_CONPW|nr:uncharacterized protein CONPUDRAFT_148121 [Coniophora puteana RWD-64-598 SS2]EIW85993.1 hypothetical protein CONPUDRAFT_148121 [Coniophora puteana RWD-64-598 SS2]
MHKAIMLPELVACICAHIDTKATLAALAATCTIFHHPSLGRLWSGDLGPITLEDLRKVLPSASEVLNSRGAITDLQLTQQDRDHFLSFTSRICHFRLENSIYYYNWSHEAAFVKLVRPPLGIERTFPKLRHLTISALEPEILSIYIRFISPRLLSLKIQCLRSGPHIMMDAVAKRCGQLQSLDVDMMYDEVAEPRMVQAVSAAVVRLPALQTLRCPDLEVSALEFLSKSECFRKLELTENAVDSRERWEQLTTRSS